MKAFAKKTFRFVFVITFILSAAFSLILPASASSAPSLDSAHAVILYSVDADEILLAKNPDLPIYPAATVKIMSSLLLCELLEDKLDEKITLTEQMLLGTVGRSFGLKVGEKMTVRHLLQIAICGSYNDAFCALAVYSSGSLSDFVSLMNEKAQALGANATNFVNATGIDNPKAQTTARDILKIAKTAAENKLYMEQNSMYSDQVVLGNGTTKTVTNRNELHNIYGKYYNNHALGFAAGMTDLGGYCVATLGSYSGAKYICIVMNTKENAEYELANSLLSFAGENYSVAVLRESGTVVGKLPITLSDSYSEIPIALASDVKILKSANTSADTDLSYDLVLTKSELRAPVEKGEQVGFYVVRNGNDIIACVPVVTAQGAERNLILGAIDDMKNTITSRSTLAALLFFAVSFVTFVIVCIVIKQKKRKKTVYARGRYR